MSKLLDTIKGFTPSNMVKEGLKNTVGIIAEKGVEIFNKVQDGKISIAEGQQELEMFKLQMERDAEQAAFEMDKAYLDDVANARDLKKDEIKSDDKLVRRFSYYLAGGTILLVFALLVLLYFVPIPEGNERIVDMSLGAFIGAALQIFVFFYGSTKGSKDKTDIMSSLIKKGNQNL